MGSGTSCPTRSVSAPSPCLPGPESPRPHTGASAGPLPQGSFLTCTRRPRTLTLAQLHRPGFRGWDSCGGRVSCHGIHHQGD